MEAVLLIQPDGIHQRRANARAALPLFHQEEAQLPHGGLLRLAQHNAAHWAVIHHGGKKLVPLASDEGLRSHSFL